MIIKTRRETHIINEPDLDEIIEQILGMRREI